MVMLRAAALAAPFTVLASLPVLLGPSASNMGQPNADGERMEVAASGVESSGDSGIAGQVHIKPMRPHATIGMSNEAPYQAKLEVLDPSGRIVISVESDASGSFRVALPPGKYVLRPQSPGPYPRASEQTIVVSPKKFTRVNVVYDSGIR
jgi:hypothetical protein